MTGADAPLPQAFAAAMAGFAPFERAPRLAVAVSGGPDSLALMLLADDWARARGGSVLALTVDHCLRPAAALEARQVAVWAAERGIPHHSLTANAPPADPGGVQAGARALRYRLLMAACANVGILHLLLGHHRDDQAETLLLRLQRGSGVSGLAGMAACQTLSCVRLLRPLLGLPKAALIEFCAQAGLTPVVDPSNDAVAYDRVRWRAVLTGAAAPFLAARLAETATRLSADRAILEALADQWLTAWVTPLPLGLARLPASALSDGPEEVRLRALARLCAWAGGAVYPPRFEGLQTLARRLEAGGQARAVFTLGGVLWVRAKGLLWVGREAAGIAPPLVLPSADLSARWDGRFRAYAAVEGWQLRALGAAEATLLRHSSTLKRPQTRLAQVLAQAPAALLAGMPAFQCLDCPACVPHLSGTPGQPPRLVTAPRRPLVAGGERGR
jgi:tRNA(Ile)-lysidine synthase